MVNQFNQLCWTTISMIMWTDNCLCSSCLCSTHPRHYEETVLYRADRRDLRVCQFYGLSSRAAVRVSQIVAGDHELILPTVRRQFPMRRQQQQPHKPARGKKPTCHMKY